MAWYKVGVCRLVWLLEQRLGVGGQVSGEQPARDPGSATPSERRWEAWPGFGFCSVCLRAGSEPNQEGREARAGPDLLGAAIRILAS